MRFAKKLRRDGAGRPPSRSDQRVWLGETRPQNQVRGAAFCVSDDFARACQWSRSRRKSSISRRKAVPVRLNFGEAAAQAFDLSLQHRDLRWFIGRVTRRAHRCAGKISPAPFGGPRRRLERLQSSDWPDMHQICAPLRVRLKPPASRIPIAAKLRQAKPTSIPPGGFGRGESRRKVNRKRRTLEPLSAPLRPPGRPPSSFARRG